MTSSRAIPRRAHSCARAGPLSAPAELISRLWDNPEVDLEPQDGGKLLPQRDADGLGDEEIVDLLHPPSGQVSSRGVHQGDHPLGGALKFRRQAEMLPPSRPARPAPDRPPPSE